MYLKHSFEKRRGGRDGLYGLMAPQRDYEEEAKLQSHYLNPGTMITRVGVKTEV